MLLHSEHCHALLASLAPHQYKLHLFKLLFIYVDTFKFIFNLESKR